MQRLTRVAPTTALEAFIGSVRGIVRSERPPRGIADAVAGRLEQSLDRSDLLAADHVRHDESRYCQNILHVEEDGSFSVVALVWLPGQSTPIHDHVSWCVTGVFRGEEHETRYRLVEDPEGEGTHLVQSGSVVNATGDIAALCPPGDIHRVGNRGPGTAVSIHVYGADIGELGSSIRNTYELPVRGSD